MNATTTILTRNATESKLAHLFRTFRMELRRAIELMGASYRNGPLPPL